MENKIIEDFSTFVSNLEKTIVEINGKPMYKHTHKTETDVFGTLDCNCTGKVEALRTVLYQNYLRKYKQL